MRTVKTVTAYFKIVTPMFLGDADGQAGRLRGESLKSQICFWWRALNFSKFMDDKNSNEEEALKALQEAEKRLFGSPVQGEGQSGVLVSFPAGVGGLESVGKGKILNAKGDQGDDPETGSGGRQRTDVVGDGARYFGYGLMQAFTTFKKRDRQRIPDGNGGFLIECEAGQLDHSCFKSGKHFMVRFQISPRLDDNDIDGFLKALKLFGLVGGIGARRRRGWGSVALVGLKNDGFDKWREWEAPITRVAYIAALKALVLPVTEKNGRNYPLTAFTSDSQIHVTTFQENNALSVLDKMGEAIVKYRGWRNGEQNFKDDHDWYRKINDFQAGRGKYMPERSAFGMPHNYNKKFKVPKEPNPGEDGVSRRASPLLFHVHQAGNQSFGVILLLPTQFLPNVKQNLELQENHTTWNIDYDFFNDGGLDVLTHFLTGEPKTRTDTTVSYGNGPYLETDKIL